MLVVVRRAEAGSREKGDVLVIVEPAEDLQVSVEASPLFRRRLEELAFEVIQDLGLRSGSIHIKDMGALDFVHRARLLTAIRRGCE